MRWVLLLAGAVGCGGFQGGLGPQGGDDEQRAQRPVCVEGDFLAGTLDTEAGACLGAIHAIAGAGGSTIAVGVDGLDADDALISVESLDGELLALGLSGDGGQVLVDLPWSGEFLVRVDVDAPTALTLTRTCVEGCELGYTRYPILLMHGMAGTDSYLGHVDYFNGVQDALIDAGYEVFVGAVDPFQITPGRAVQWSSHLDAIFADARHRRINLIGHSQGGMDARYVASHLDPEHRVASVLTIATPHHGTELAAVGAGILEHSAITAGLVQQAFNGLANFYSVDSDAAIIEQIQGLAPDAMAEFNAVVPDREDVYYASWGGRSCQLVDLRCLWQTDGEIIAVPLAAAHLILQLLEGDNDGLVSVDSARWGVDYGALPADHADQVGLLNVFAFDHLAFYLDEADWLYQLGF